MYKYKIFLGGMVGDCVQDCDELTKDIYQYFDGLIFCENNSKDGTRELLESRKGNGEIISMPWLRNHGICMNVVLTSQKLLPGDFIFFSDSLERMSVDFCKNIRSFTDELTKRNINTLYSYGKIFGIRYYPEIQFTVISPHCHIPNPRPHGIEMSQIEEFKDPKTYRYNIRGEKRNKDSFIDHFVKYIYEYKISNHLLVGKENNIEKYRTHEEVRQKFMLHCVNTLKLELTVASLKNYILNNELDYQTKWFFNFEPYLNYFYCYHKLKHPVDDILKRSITEEIFKIE